jgi:hypothetical protein
MGGHRFEVWAPDVEKPPPYIPQRSNAAAAAAVAAAPLTRMPAAAGVWDVPSPLHNSPPRRPPGKGAAAKWAAPSGP